MGEGSGKSPLGTGEQEEEEEEEEEEAVEAGWDGLLQDSETEQLQEFECLREENTQVFMWSTNNLE